MIAPTYGYLTPVHGERAATYIRLLRSRFTIYPIFQGSSRGTLLFTIVAIGLTIGKIPTVGLMDDPTMNELPICVHLDWPHHWQDSYHWSRVQPHRERVSSSRLFVKEVLFSIFSNQNIISRRAGEGPSDSREIDIFDGLFKNPLS